MKSRSHTLPVLSLLALLAFPGAASAAEASRPARTKPPLTQFMAADFIRDTYGKPNEIRPMKQPDGRLKVEQWLYRRRAGETTTQTASNQTTIPAFIGITGTGQPNIADVPVPEYRLKHIVIYQVTALLMIDDQLTSGSQWLEREESYD